MNKWVVVTKDFYGDERVVREFDNSNDAYEFARDQNDRDPYRSYIVRKR